MNPVKKQINRQAKNLIQHIWQYLYIDFLALLCGMIGGASAILFTLTIKWGHGWIFGNSALSLGENYPWWRIVIPLLLAGLISGLLSRFLRYKRPLGVVGVVEMCALRNGHMPFKEGLLNALLHKITLMLGISAGREGPAIHLAATFVTPLLRHLHIHSNYHVLLIGCAAAGAIGASFNAALAGALFAWEVIIGRGRLQMLLPLAIGGGGGLILSYLIYGNVGMFYIPEIQITSDWIYPSMIVMGVGAGIIGGLFIIISNKIYYWHHQNAHPILFRTMLGATLLSILAVYFPQIIGAGYYPIYLNLFGSWSLSFMIIIFVAKFAATAITIGTGIGGGVWVLCLIMGASFGAVSSSIFQTFLPEIAGSHTFFIVAGMATFIASILGAPLTALLFVIEHNGNFQVVLATLLGVVVSTQIASNVFSHSFYSHTLIGEAGSGWVHRKIPNFRLSCTELSEKAKIIEGDEKASKAIKMLGANEDDMIFVIDRHDGRFLGVIGWREALHGKNSPKLTCHDIMGTKRMALEEDNDIERIWEIMEINPDPAFAILDQNYRIESCIRRSTILKYVQKQVR